MVGGLGAILAFGLIIAVVEGELETVPRGFHLCIFRTLALLNVCSLFGFGVNALGELPRTYQGALELKL